MWWDPILPGEQQAEPEPTQAEPEPPAREIQDDNPIDEGMKKLVISLNPDRRAAIDYGHQTIPGMMYPEVPAHIKKNFKIMYNEHRKGEGGKPVPPTYDEESNMWTSLPEGKVGKKPRGRMGCFGAHCRALRHVAENKIDNVVILEDDAQIDRKSMGIRPGETFDTSHFPQDGPTLLAGMFHHPGTWGKDKKWIKEDLPKLMPKFKKGINKIDYDKKRFTGAFSIYYPKWEVARDTLKKIEDIGHANKNKLGSGPYKHFDIFLSEHRLVPYFHFPTLFTHNDTLDKNRNYKKSSSNIADGEGILKNYMNLGKEIKTVEEHTPPYEWKTMLKQTGNKLTKKQHRARSK